MSHRDSLPKPEYPRAQFVRGRWKNLNGRWQFERDPGDSGLARGLLERPLNEHILVPFCPESPLSGIGNTDFMPVVWYRKTVQVPKSWAGQRVLLHFQAVDYDATVWVNGKEVGRHRGGFTPFTCDLGVMDFDQPITIALRVRDDSRRPQPRGKQSQRYEQWGCRYTRTTGIWQTVWMEPVPPVCALLRPRITPDVANSMFHLEQPITNNPHGWRLRATLSDQSGIVLQAECPADRDFTPRLDLPIPKERRHLWSPQTPFLYDLEIALLDGEKVIDRATSYAGLRSITIDDLAVKINSETVFQRLVLDQGYYDEGVMTAPSDDALKHDIELTLAAGFNGARLHQKVFEERYLYHADKLGLLVHAEFPDWACDDRVPGLDDLYYSPTFVTQWLEQLHRDYSHPSIILWCGLNETLYGLGDRITTVDDVTRAMFLAAKAIDTTRPVLDASGFAHRVFETDIYDSHDYVEEEDFAEGLEKFRERHAHLDEGKPFINLMSNNSPTSVPYSGQPYFVSEFGGIKWTLRATPADQNWGYGSTPSTPEEFSYRFQSLVDALLDSGHFGYCYTQLTDVGLETNGLLTSDRHPKFDLERLRMIQSRRAKIEGTGG